MKNRTIIFDLESYSQPCTLGGIPAGELMVMSAGRQTGNSMYMRMTKDRIYNVNLCKEILLPMFQQKTKYQFSRKKWYEGTFNAKQYDEVRAWCEQNFGKHPKRPDAWSRWNHMYEDMILFRDEKDYMMFVLRWS